VSALTRRAFGGAVLGAIALPGREAGAFGEEGAFHPRVLLTGTSKLEGVRASAPARWAAEVVQRTSAPAKLSPSSVRADEANLCAEPFAWWMGDADVPALTQKEIKTLAKFFALGGVLLVDDTSPDGASGGKFQKAAKREIARVLPESSPIEVGSENVLFRSFYLLKRPLGRVEGPAKIGVIVRGGLPQVIFLAHDLAGALARSSSGTHPVAVTPGGDAQRETAVRLAVNVAMYVLCSNYKDDQVHAPFLMRRRSSQ